MSEKKLYSYTALFNTPDEIIHAAEKVSEKGYKNYDVNTPYPVHGMDSAMKLPPSKLGYVALVLGISGIMAGLLMTYWMSAVDYPVNIGGKPIFSFPAYIPIIFEITVLFASVGTVLAMLLYFFKLPNNTHPLHGTNYMKAVSSDKYGISIAADDKLFVEEEVINLFKELGSSVINPVYYDEEEISNKHKIFEPKFIMFLIIAFILTSGTTYVTLNKLMYMVPFDWMSNQEKVIPQSKSIFYSDGFGMRTPVEGTISRGHIPYPYKGDPEAASTMTNPLLPTKENMKIGQQKYDTFCSPCHGFHAEGDSRLRGQFPNPPSLHSEKVRNWSDGRIFHVLMEGQNIMPAYNTQLSNDEMWAVILHLRALQRSLNAKETDLQ